MGAILNHVADLMVWGAVALLAWGAVLTLGHVLAAAASGDLRA